MESRLLPHLNVQTNSNLSFSFLSLPQLINWASEKQLKYLAIADYYPYDIIDFFKLCKAKKIKPVWGVKIFGQEESESRKHPITVYPQNNKGYKEVFQKLFSPDSPRGRVFLFDYILKNLSQNCLIVLEAQKLEEIKHLATRWILVRSPDQEVNYNNLFIGFNFFLPSDTQSLARNIIPLLLPFFSIKTFIPTEIELLNLWRRSSFNRYFFSSDTRNSLPYLTTEEYFSRCTNDKTLYQLLLIQWQNFLARIKLNPSWPGEKINRTKKDNSFLLLQGKCWQKLLELNKEKEGKYQEVLEKELNLIEKLNYTDYFLILSDAVEHSRKKGIIVGPGRGSSVSSLVAYLLGITSIDPLRHNLFFERFLNEKRKTLPDIDLDVGNQEEIFNYLQEKYPKNQVARLIVKKKIGWRNACQEIAKLWKTGEIKAAEIISLWEKNFSDNIKLQSWKINYPGFFALVEKIQDLYYDVVLHPAGIIVAERSLVGLVPLQTEKNYSAVLLEKEKVEEIGLRKYDFLGLRETIGFIDFGSLRQSFTFLQEVRKSLQIGLPDYQNLNLHDEKTWQLFKNFLLTGVFQLDTPSARSLFIRFRPQNFSELIIFLALNRPSTKEKAEKISQSKNNLHPSPFTSPVIKKILAETYGFIIFEEQISQILAWLYDCSFAEAEVKRRELTVKGNEKEFFQLLRKKLPFEEGKLIYKELLSALSYTFNKAHAVAYGYLTYYIAYLKANFFSELITHLLNEKTKKTLSYCQEAFFLGFAIQGPDVNHSELNWSKKNHQLTMGFSNLKEYREDFFQKVITEREKKGVYKNWADFLNRTVNDWEKIEITTFEKWIKSNLFASLQVGIDSLLEQKEAIFRYLKIRQKISATATSLPFLDLSTEKKVINEREINKNEYENLGLYISYFSRWKEASSQFDYKINSLLSVFLETEVETEKLINVYAIIQQIEKKDSENYILLLQDIRNSFKLNIDESVYQTNQLVLVVHNELLFTLKVERKTRKLTCEKISEVHISIN